MSYSTNIRSNSDHSTGAQLSRVATTSSIPFEDPVASEGHLLSVYTDFIKSCYLNHPEAFSYYEQLVDYLGTGSKKGSQLSQEYPESFQALSASSTERYPFSFPFKELEWQANSKRPRAAVLEGFPPPDMILRLGTRWKLRPELFIGHIFGNSGSNQRVGFYGLPTLPSRQDNIMRINFTSLVKSLVEGPSMGSYLEKRAEIENARRQCDNDLFLGKGYGATRFREVNQHDGYYCSVEQTISFTVVADRKSWVAVYLTDQGKTLLHNSSLPWTSYSNGGMPLGTLPIVPYNAPIAHNRPEHHLQRAQSHTSDYGQFHPLRNIVVQDSTDMGLLLEDPFFLLASLFTTSALSFVQLLNYLSESIAEIRTMDTTLLNVKLERLRHSVAIIHRIELSLTENIHWIKQGGCTDWPKAASAETSARKKELQAKLCGDHEHLLQRCSIMRRDCESATSLLVSYSQLLFAEQGISQAAEVHHLTKLASFFVPLGFVASVFGMNVQELKSLPSIWIFAVVATCTSLASFAVMHWPRGGLRKSIRAGREMVRLHKLLAYLKDMI